MVRQEVMDAGKHVLTPPNHRILGLMAMLIEEDEATTKITKTFRMWMTRKTYKREIGILKQQAFKRQKKGEESGF